MSTSIPDDALAPATASPTSRILDLPAELRLLIYQHALIEARPLWLVTDAIGVTASSSVEIPWPDIFRSAPKGWALLLVSKQIHAETAPMLYSENCFHPESEVVLTSFLRMVGSNVEYITAIDLGFTYTYVSARDTLPLLLDIPRLQHLYLEMSQLICCVKGITNSGDPKVWAEVVAREFRTFLLGVQQRRKRLKGVPGQDEGWSAVEMVSFRIEELLGSNEEGVAESVADCEEAFKGLVKRYLE